jgi:hypothetical protein
MTTEEHKERHRILHNHLDELFADYIANHPNHVKFTQEPIMNLLKWSNDQTKNPTDPPQ